MVAWCWNAQGLEQGPALAAKWMQKVLKRAQLASWMMRESADLMGRA